MKMNLCNGVKAMTMNLCNGVKIINECNAVRSMIMVITVEVGNNLNLPKVYFRPPTISLDCR